MNKILITHFLLLINGIKYTTNRKLNFLNIHVFQINTVLLNFILIKQNTSLFTQN